MFSRLKKKKKKTKISVKKRKPVKKIKKKIAKPKKKSVKKTAKKTAKKIIRKKLSKKPIKQKDKPIGKITHYFPHVKAAVFKTKVPLEIKDVILIKGHTTNFKQKITSMQIDRTIILKAKKGDEIGLKVAKRVRRKDLVYKI